VEVAKERDVLIAELKKKIAAAQEAGAAPQHVIIEIISDGKRQVIELPAGSRVISGQAGDDVRVRVLRGASDNKVPPPVAMPKIDMKPGQPFYGVVPKAPADTEKRVADLEKRLEELMRAVKELHGELNRVKPPMAPMPPTPPARIRPPVPQEGSTDPFLPVPPTPPQAK
jgi:hypothetical protein